MTAAQSLIKTLPWQKQTVIHTTLLDLVQAVNQVTNDDAEVAATVARMVNTGRARLTGTFKNARLIIE